MVGWVELDQSSTNSDLNFSVVHMTEQGTDCSGYDSSRPFGDSVTHGSDDSVIVASMVCDFQFVTDSTTILETIFFFT